MRPHRLLLLGVQVSSFVGSVSLYELLSGFWPRGAHLTLLIVIPLFAWLASPRLAGRFPGRGRRFMALVLLFTAGAAVHTAVTHYFHGHPDRDSFLKSAGHCPAPVLTPLSRAAGAVSHDVEEIRSVWEDVCRTTALGTRFTQTPESICGKTDELFACYPALAKDIAAQAPLSETGNLLMMAVGVDVVAKDAKQKVDRGMSQLEAAVRGALDVVEMSALNVKALSALAEKPSSDKSLFGRLRAFAGFDPTRELLKTARETLKDIEPKIDELYRENRETADRFRERYRTLQSHILGIPAR